MALLKTLKLFKVVQDTDPLGRILKEMLTVLLNIYAFKLTKQSL